LQKKKDLAVEKQAEESLNHQEMNTTLVIRQEWSESRFLRGTRRLIWASMQEVTQ